MDKGALSCLQEKLEACLPEIRAADMRQKDIDNGLVDLHPTDGEIEKAPTEPTGPRLKSPKAAPKKSLAESMTPTTAPPEPGEDDIDYNDPKLIKQEQEAEKLADLDEKIIMDDAQKKLDSIPKAEFEAAEQIVDPWQSLALARSLVSLAFAQSALNPWAASSALPPLAQFASPK